MRPPGVGAHFVESYGGRVELPPLGVTLSPKSAVRDTRKAMGARNYKRLPKYC